MKEAEEFAVNCYTKYVSIVLNNIDFILLPAFWLVSIRFGTGISFFSVMLPET